MTWLALYLLALAGLLAFNRGAHRKPSPSPDPLVQVRKGVWVRASEAWRWR